jgi:hypothetical protein
MRHTIRAALAASFCLFALAATGCTARTILSFQDHPKHPVTNLQVFETNSYWIYATSEHQFFTCVDSGSQLVCKRSCGGATDITCPSDVATGYGNSTNVR